MPKTKICGVCGNSYVCVGRGSGKRGQDYIYRCENCQKQRDIAGKKRSGRYYKLLRHGITPEIYEEMLKAQDNRCKICKKTSKESFRVDHDHDTGKLRDLLCHRCNVGLGFFDENPELLIASAKYLIFHRQRA